MEYVRLEDATLISGTQCWAFCTHFLYLQPDQQDFLAEFNQQFGDPVIVGSASLNLCGLYFTKLVHWWSDLCMLLITWSSDHYPFIVGIIVFNNDGCYESWSGCYEVACLFSFSFLIICLRLVLIKLRRLYRLVNIRCLFEWARKWVFDHSLVEPGESHLAFTKRIQYPHNGIFHGSTDKSVNETIYCALCVKCKLRKHLSTYMCALSVIAYIVCFCSYNSDVKCEAKNSGKFRNGHFICTFKGHRRVN